MADEGAAHAMSIHFGQQRRPIATGRRFIIEVADAHIGVKDWNACAKLQRSHDQSQSFHLFIRPPQAVVAIFLYREFSAA